MLFFSQELTDLFKSSLFFIQIFWKVPVPAGIPAGFLFQFRPVPVPAGTENVSSGTSLKSMLLVLRFRASTSSIVLCTSKRPVEESLKSQSLFNHAVLYMNKYFLYTVIPELGKYITVIIKVVKRIYNNKSIYNQ